MRVNKSPAPRPSTESSRRLPAVRQPGAPRWLILLPCLLIFALGACAPLARADTNPTKTPVKTVVATPIPVPPTATSVPTATPTALSTPEVNAVPPPVSTISSGMADGLTLTVNPGHGGVGTGVKIEGSIAPNLQTSQSVTVEFLPSGPHRSLGDKSNTKYTGPIWPSRWTVRVDANGHFVDVVKVPKVIQTYKGELWEIEPGTHAFAIVADQNQGTYASVAFQVVAPPPPTTPSPPTTQFHQLWLANATQGWLTGVRCQEESPATPDANQNVPTPAPARCQGLIESTSDGGKTWHEQYQGDVQPSAIQFVGTQTGWMIGAKGAQCLDDNCPSALLRTTDGGAHWTSIYTTWLRLTDVDFTSPTEGWLLGQACATNENRSDCPWHLLVTDDGGETWRDSVVSIQGYILDVDHPTTWDGWITASTVAGGAQIIATHDDGRTWQALPDPSPKLAWDQLLFFRTPKEGWLLATGQPAAGSQMKELYGTTDGGRTWTRLATTGVITDQQTAKPHGLPLGGYAGPMVFSTASNGWIASPRGGLLHSTDGGKTWDAPTVPDHYFVGVHFADSDHGWALSLHGLWATSDGGKNWHQVALPTATA